MGGGGGGQQHFRTPGACPCSPPSCLPHPALLLFIPVQERLRPGLLLKQEGKRCCPTQDMSQKGFGAQEFRAGEEKAHVQDSSPLPGCVQLCNTHNNQK